MISFHPSERRRICIDFDGVLATYTGWKGRHHHGKPISGAKKFLKKLEKANIDFIVHSTRGDEPAKLWKWFEHHHLPMPIQITHKKVIATVYVDDRAVYFSGDFEKLAKTLANFKVHWKKGKPLKALSKVK